MFRCLAIALIWVLASSGVAASDTLLTARAIKAGEVLTHDDLLLSEANVSGALRSYDQAVGLQAARSLFPGRAVFANDLREPHIIERNQPVLVTFFRGGLSISTSGRALDGGAIGDTIRVLNSSSKTTIRGKILVDGTISALGGHR